MRLTDERKIRPQIQTNDDKDSTGKLGKTDNSKGNLNLIPLSKHALTSMVPLSNKTLPVARTHIPRTGKVVATELLTTPVAARNVNTIRTDRAVNHFVSIPPRTPVKENEIF